GNREPSPAAAGGGAGGGERGTPHATPRRGRSPKLRRRAAPRRSAETLRLVRPGAKAITNTRKSVSGFRSGAACRRRCRSQARLKRRLSILRLWILEESVVSGVPSFAAAADDPAPFPPHSASAASISLL